MEKQNKSRLMSWPWLLGMVIAAALLLPFTAWVGPEASPLTIWVLDKTVPHPDYREHAGFFWILDYARIENPATGQLYDCAADYYGFHPEEDGAYTVSSLPTGVHYPAMIYITDTYGVYRDDYGSEEVRGYRSPTIYGGLTEKDLNAIESNLGGNTLIAEFNCLGSPTEPETREGLEKVLGMRWEGWNGQYFDQLDRGVEVPGWMVSNYESQTHLKWNYTGPGIVLTSSDSQVIVLVWKDDLGSQGLNFVMNPDFAGEFNADDIVPYYSYFEISSPEEDTEVLASFRMELTASGQEKLAGTGLKAEFPAVLRCKADDYTAYYFAGDFADNVELPSLYQYTGWHLFRKTFSINIRGDQQAFYWRAYVPLMLKIIDDVKLQAQE